MKKIDFYDIGTNKYRKLSADIIDYFDDRRGHTTTGEAYYALEDDLTRFLMKWFDVKVK